MGADNTKTDEQYAVAVPEGFVLQEEVSVPDPEISGSIDSALTPISPELEARIAETQGVPAEPVEAEPQGIEYAVEVPEGFVLQTEDIFEGIGAGAEEIRQAPEPSILDRAQQLFRDFKEGGPEGRAKRADLVVTMANKLSLPVSFVDKNLDSIMSNPKLTSIRKPFTAEEKKKIAFTQSAIEGLTFGVFDPDEVIQREFPVQAAAGAVTGGVAIFLTTGGVLKALGLGGVAVRAGLKGEAIFAAAPRFLPPAIMTGSTFATVGGIREAVEQVEKKDINPLKLGGEIMLSFGEGFGLGFAGQSVGQGRRVLMAAGLGYVSGKTRGHSNEEAAVQGAIWGGIEVFGGIGRDQNLKNRAIIDLRDRLATYAKKVKPDMSVARSVVEAHKYMNRLARSMGVSLDEALTKTPIKYLERASKHFVKLIKDFKGTKGVNALDLGAQDLAKEAAKLPVKTAGPMKGKFTAAEKGAVKEVLDLVSFFEPTQKVRTEEGLKILAGGFPEDLGKKGYSTKDLEAVAAKVEAGKPLTERQTGIFNDMMAVADKAGLLLPTQQGAPSGVLASVEPIEDIPAFKNTEAAEAFGKAATPAQVQALQNQQVKLQTEFDNLMDAGKENEALLLASGQKQFVNEALKVVKPLAAAGEPSLGPVSKGEVAKPILNQNQLKKIQKKKDIKLKQEDIGDLPTAHKVLSQLIRQRRAEIDTGNFLTNKFVNQLEQQLTPEQEMMIPFIIEGTDMPKEVEEIFNLPGLVERFNQQKELLKPIAKQVSEHFNEGWAFMQENMDQMTAQEIENYVTHFWNLPKQPKHKGKKHGRAEIVNWFVTRNKFLKKRVIATYAEGIRLGYKPKTLNITELIKVHDNIMIKSIANQKLVKQLMNLRANGVPLIERVDKAPIDWVYFPHPALQKALFIPGAPKRGEKVSNDLIVIMNELGLAIGRRLSPTVFGRPSRTLGVFRLGKRPPEIALRRFFETRTLAHEIGHFIDSKLRLGESFVNRFKDEIYALNRERIEKFRGQPGPYGQEYAESVEEQIAEFFAFLFADTQKAYDVAPNATSFMLKMLRTDGTLSRLVDLNFENNAKVTLEEQLNVLTKLPVKVHPDLAKPLKVVFDERFNHPVINAYEAINGVLKKTELSFSLFHHFALGETSVAMIGPKRTFNIAFNPKRVYKALAEGQYDVFLKEEVALDAIESGVQFGATADIPVKKIQKALDDFATATKNKAILGKAAEYLATFNKVWDKALWNYYHDALKLYAYEHLITKIDPNGNIKKQKEEIAQIVNDTFGGQNWELLMVTPKTLQLASWGLLSPDWTTSTVRQGMALTGAGAIHKETKPLRAKIGQFFWLKAFLYFGVGINLLNVATRKYDQSKNPGKYKGFDSLVDFTLLGNSIGHKTHIFAGRFEDGSERYIRWGKQFREVPELIVDDLSINPFSATVKKIGSKVAPVPQALSLITTGHTLSGFEVRDISEAEGWSRTFATVKQLLKTPLPFASRNIIEEGKEFAITDLAMPSSKGMTRAKAIRLYKIGIERSDERIMKEVFTSAIMNGLPAASLMQAASSSIKAEKTIELKRNLRSIEQVEKALKSVKDIKDKERLLKMRMRMLTDEAEVKVIIEGLDLFNLRMSEIKAEFGID